MPLPHPYQYLKISPGFGYSSLKASRFRPGPPVLPEHHGYAEYRRYQQDYPGRAIFRQLRRRSGAVIEQQEAIVCFPGAVLPLLCFNTGCTKYPA